MEIVDWIYNPNTINLNADIDADADINADTDANADANGANKAQIADKP